MVQTARFGVTRLIKNSTNVVIYALGVTSFHSAADFSSYFTKAVGRSVTTLLGGMSTYFNARKQAIHVSLCIIKRKLHYHATKTTKRHDNLKRYTPKWTEKDKTKLHICRELAGEVAALQCERSSSQARIMQLQRLNVELQQEMYRLAAEAGLGPFMLLDAAGNVSVLAVLELVHVTTNTQDHTLSRC